MGFVEILQNLSFCSFSAKMFFDILAFASQPLMVMDRIRNSENSRRVTGEALINNSLHRIAVDCSSFVNYRRNPTSVQIWLEALNEVLKNRRYHYSHSLCA